MSIELQNIDCNCNNCVFMVRDFDKFNQSKIDRDRWQRLTFDNTKDKMLRDAKDYQDSGKTEKARNLREIVSRMKYQFLNDSKINYGDCGKFKKPVSFIPETCQLDTQECFENRKS